MGAADAVPGVSGGTIAFITGIYDRFVQLIAGFGPGWIRAYRQQGWPGLVRQWDLPFSVPLGLGIVIGMLAISRWVLFALDRYPALIWSLFLGLVLAAVPLVLRGYDWRPKLAWGLAGLALAAGMGLFNLQLPQTSLGVFLAGLIALSAMILPGISGSFLLLLLGMYSLVFEAIHRLDLSVIGWFALGGVVGIASMARALRWAFQSRPVQVRTFLAGLMLGSAAQLWPFQHTAATPGNLALALLGLILGGVLLWSVDRLARVS